MPGSHRHLNRVFLSLPTPLPPPHSHHPPPQHTPDPTQLITGWPTIHQPSTLLYPQVWDGYMDTILNNSESQSEKVIPSAMLFQSLTTRRKLQQRDSCQAVGRAWTLRPACWVQSLLGYLRASWLLCASSPVLYRREFKWGRSKDYDS